MPRITKDPEERRNEILDVAMELFNSKGFEYTSVSDIVKKIGVAQGTFYYYFKSKEEIVNAACERTLSARLVDVKLTMDNSDLNAVEKLNQIFLLTLPSRHEQENAVFEYLHNESNRTLHQKWIVAKINALIPYFKELVQQGVNEGHFQAEQPEEAMEFLLVGYSFWLDRGIFAWTDEEYARKKQALSRLIDRLLGGQSLIASDMSQK